MVAKIDDDDYAWISQHKWYVSKIGYAVRNMSVNGKQKTIYMHKEIKVSTKEVDHKNCNKLDNRKANLRVSVDGGNQRNVPKRNNNSSGFKGVYWHDQRKTWRAQIRIKEKSVYLGLFKNKLDAAIAYNKAAKKLFGNFAQLNKIV